MLINTTQHNTTQHNTTQHNTTQHNTTQHNTTQHNTTQHIDYLGQRLFVKQFARLFTTTMLLKGRIFHTPNDKSITVRKVVD